MSKLEWGSKRVCLNCSTRFYDLQKRPIVCPKCAATYEAEFFTKPRKGRVSSDMKKGPAEALILENEETDFLMDEGDLEEVSLDDNELIEDTSELDTEGDDVIDVIENVDSSEGEE